MQNVILHRTKEWAPTVDLSFETKDHYIDVVQTTKEDYLGEEAEYNVVVRERDGNKTIRSIDTGTDECTVEQAIAVAFCSISELLYEFKKEY